MRKGVVCGKNKPSLNPCGPQLHPDPLLSSTEHTSRVTALWPCSPAGEGQGSLEVAELSVTHFCPTHCATLGKSHDVPELQMSSLNVFGLYCGDVSINATSAFLPKESFLIVVGRDGDSVVSGGQGGRRTRTGPPRCPFAVAF